MADLNVVGIPVVQGTPDLVTLRVEYPPQYSDDQGRAAISAYVGVWTQANGWRQLSAPAQALTLPGAAVEGAPAPRCTFTETVMQGGLPRVRSWEAVVYDNSGVNGAVGSGGSFNYALPQNGVRVLDSGTLSGAIADVPEAVANANTAAAAANAAKVQALQAVADSAQSRLLSEQALVRLLSTQDGELYRYPTNAARNAANPPNGVWGWAADHNNYRYRENGAWVSYDPAPPPPDTGEY